MRGLHAVPGKCSVQFGVTKDVDVLNLTLVATVRRGAFVCGTRQVDRNNQILGIK